MLCLTVVVVQADLHTLQLNGDNDNTTLSYLQPDGAIWDITHSRHLGVTLRHSCQAVAKVRRDETISNQLPSAPGEGARGCRQAAQN